MKTYKSVVLATGNHKGQNISSAALVDTLLNTKLPIELSMEFIKSPLDGKLGSLIALYVSSTNKLYGVFEIPNDVVDTIGKPGFSVAWDIITNVITAAAITKSPFKFK